MARNPGSGRGAAVVARAAVLFGLLAGIGGPAAGAPLEDSALGGLPFTGAVHPDPAAIHLNPAALGLVARGPHLYLGGHLQLDQLRVNRRLIDPDTGDQVAGPSASDLTATPAGMVAMQWGLPSGVTLALASFTPLAERFPDDPAFRYHTRGGHAYQWTFLDLAVAYQPLSRFIFGVAIGLGNINSLRLKYSRDRALDGGTAGLDADCGGGSPCGMENAAAEQRYRIQVQSTDFSVLDVMAQPFSVQNLSLSAGIAYEVSRDWWLGLGYSGPTGVFGQRHLDGDVTVHDAPLDGGFTRHGDAVVGFGLPHAFNAAVRGPLPRMPGWDLTVGARLLLSGPHHQFDVRLYGGDLGPSVPEWQPRYRGFDWSARAHVGLERQESARLRLGGRLLFENSTIFPDETSPMQVAGTRLGLAGALEWRATTRLVLGVAYAFSWFPTVDTGNSVFDPLAQVRCVDSGYDLDACASARQGDALPTAAGRYTRLLHVMSLSLRVDFI